jgi:hypothetical protein
MRELLKKCTLTRKHCGAHKKVWRSLVVLLLAIDMHALGDGEGDSISLLGRKWELGSLHTGSGDASEETLSLQDARVTAAVEFARKTWSEQSNSLEQYTTSRILSATTLSLEGLSVFTTYHLCLRELN